MLSFGDWIRQSREEKEWTQAELASKSGIPQTTISGWERKATIFPSMKHLNKVAHVFSVRLCEIPIYCEASRNKDEKSPQHGKHKSSVSNG